LLYAGAAVALGVSALTSTAGALLVGRLHDLGRCGDLALHAAVMVTLPSWCLALFALAAAVQRALR
jgi:hypothetical protein